jgi:hypothetical protein
MQRLRGFLIQRIAALAAALAARPQGVRSI